MYGKPFLRAATIGLLLVAEAPDLIGLYVGDGNVVDSGRKQPLRVPARFNDEAHNRISRNTSDPLGLIA